MDFGWALAAMKNGEKVRRRAWDALAHLPAEYVAVELVDESEGWAPQFVVMRNDRVRAMYEPNTYQLLAEDWELA